MSKKYKFKRKFQYFGLFFILSRHILIYFKPFIEEHEHVD